MVAIIAKGLRDSIPKNENTIAIADKTRRPYRISLYIVIVLRKSSMKLNILGGYPIIKYFAWKLLRLFEIIITFKNEIFKLEVSFKYFWTNKK